MLSLHQASTVPKQPSLGSEPITLEDTSSKALEAQSSTQELESMLPAQYRLYKRRWAGLIGLIILNIVSAMQVIQYLNKELFFPADGCKCR
jgi:hypothetical protein